MSQEDRENFYRAGTLIYETGTETKQKLLDFHLAHNRQNITLNVLIDMYSHELFHLYFKYPCCRCIPGQTSISKETILTKKQMNIIFDTAWREPTHKKVKNYDVFCCRRAKFGLRVENLDISLLHTLLVNICYDLFWDSCLDKHHLTIDQFLNNNTHFLYHLFQKGICCLGPSNCTSSPSVVGKIDQIQWDCLYHQDTTSKKCNIYGPGCACIYYAKPGLSESHIDKGLSSVIHRNLCELRRAVDKISSLRNDLAHSTSFQLSRVEFDSIWNEATTYIRSIASYIGKEPDVIAIIETVLFRPLEDGAYKKLLASILEFRNLQQTFSENIDSLRVEMREVKSSLSTIGEKQEEQLLKVTETLQKMDETQQEMRNEMKAQITEELTIVFKAEMEDFIGKINDTIKENKEQLNHSIHNVKIKNASEIITRHDMKIENSSDIESHSSRKVPNGMISREKYKNDNTDDKIGSKKRSTWSKVKSKVKSRFCSFASSLVKKKQEKFIKGIEEEGINDHPDDKFQCGSCKDNVYGGLLKIIEHRKNCTARVDKRELTETTLPVLLEVKNLPKSNENRFKQEGKQNSGSLDNDVIEVYDADLGSLILWTKISKACFLSRKTFGNTFQNFFAKVLREHPLDTTVETDLTVTVHILDDFCDLESDDLEGDVYQCGICEDKFTRLRSFMNHKKDKCSRKPKLVSEMSFRNKLMEGLPEEEFSRVTKERKDKDKADFVNPSLNTDADVTARNLSKSERNIGQNIPKSMHPESSSTSGYETDTESRNRQHHRRQFQFKKVPQSRKTLHEIEDISESSGYETTADFTTFSSITPEKIPKQRVERKIADTFRKSKYLPKDKSSSDSDSENDMVPNTTGAMNYFQQSCQLSKEYKNKEFFHSHAIQHGLKLSKRCVARLQNECARENKGKKDFYTEFLKPQKLLSLLQRYPMKYKQGILQIDSSHGAICKIKNATDGIDLIVISGRSKCGKAYTDDEVVVEVLLENSEIPRLGKIIQPRQKVFGKVVGILARKRKENIDHPVYVCELDSFDNYKAKPICKTIPKLHLVRKNVKEKNYFTVDLYKYNAERKDLLPDRQMRITPSRRRKYLFYVVFISWPATYPIGVAIDVHKSTTSFLNGMRILDLQYEIPTIYKPSTVTKLQQKLHVKFADKKADREDLTENIKAFTIDPKGTKVLDDAISIDKSYDGSFRVGVHISDVTAYIEKGDEIDIEAAERGTTYFSGRYNDPHCMLPEPLSLDTCSLLPGLSRLTITVFLFFGSDFKPRAHTIGKSYIKSSEQLSYEQVQAVIDGHSVKSKWKEHIDDLFRIATAVRRNRLGNAMWGVPFEYDFGEDLETRTNCFEAYYLIEEFMILANESVAKLLMSLPLFKDRVPLRCQDAPPTKRVQDWLKSYPKILDQIIQLQGVKPLEHREISFANLEDGRRLRYTEISFIQKWIWNLFTSYMNEGNFRQAGRLLRQDEIHPYQALAIDEWISFQENAEYRCSGNLANKRQGSHFGLNKYPYVHFTAPIRRYIDIVTHRLLHAAISPTTTAKDIPYSSKEVQTICTQMNRISLQAKTYDNKCKSLHLASDLQKKPTVFYGFVKFSSDQDLALVFPGLRYLNDECTTLTLNNLDVCCQPIFKRDVERVNLPAERNIMELIWDKRIYSNLKRRPYPKTPRNGYQYAQNDEPQRIDPHQRTEIHQSTKWMKFLVSACSINNLSKCKQSFTEITDASPLRYVTTSFDTEYDINCELEKKRQPDENIVDTQTPNEDGLNSLSTKTKSKTEKRRKYPSIITKQSCKFSMTFSHGQVVSVQMSANIQKGILTPYIQFVDMTENVKFCLEHMRDPVYCLEQYTVNKTKPKYENLEEYKDIWLPIIQMESVMSAVRSDTIVINDVDVHLKDSDGSFNLKSEFCDERNIILSSMAISFLDKNVPADGSEESKKYYMPRTDYLCIRCPLFRNPLEPGSGYSLDKPSEFTTWNKWRPDEYYIWSTHAKITSVDTYKNSGNIVVNFRIHKNAGKQPPDLPSGKNRLKKCCVEIMPKSAIAMRIENAIRFLHEATALSRSIAIKKNIPDFNDADDHLKAISQTDIEIGLPKNNKDQKKAIKMALTKRFCLIHGPPGTGKTNTAIKLIYLFDGINKRIEQDEGGKKCILFCGPSNKSVDLVAVRFLNNVQQLQECPRITRLYGGSLANCDFPIPGKFYSAKKGDEKPEEMLRSISIHWIIRREDKPYAAEIKEFENAMEDESKLKVDVIKEYTELLSKATREELTNYDVIFCTTSVATNSNLFCNLKNEIYQVIIDESGMCTEPECLATIIATRAEQVVLIGDHKQLKPVIQCQQADRLGLSKSLFERYWQSNNVVQMKTQYRMHKSICDFPSSRFYGGKLQTGKSTSYEEDPPLQIWGNNNDKRHIFCHVEGEEDILTVSSGEGNIMSRSNKEEVKQVELEKEGYHDVNVNTVNGSQGGEWDYVIFSLVRSLPEFRIEQYPTLGWCKRNLGFITDENQINVALTRAKKGLFIIGNRHLLSCNQVWKKLINTYGSLGCVYDAAEFPKPFRKVNRKRSRGRSQEVDEEGFQMV